MGDSASRAVDSAADSVSNATGSVRNDIDNTFGHTNSIQNASNREYNIGRWPSRGLINNTWGAHPKSTPFDRIVGRDYMATTKPVNKTITKHQDATAHHSKHIPHVKASKSKHIPHVKASKSTQNTTHHNKKS